MTHPSPTGPPPSSTLVSPHPQACPCCSSSNPVFPGPQCKLIRKVTPTLPSMCAPPYSRLHSSTTYSMHPLQFPSNLRTLGTPSGWTQSKVQALMPTKHLSSTFEQGLVPLGAQFSHRQSLPTSSSPFSSQENPSGIEGWTFYPRKRARLGPEEKLTAGC